MNSFQTAAGRLSEILGPNRVVTDRDVLAAYAEDETSDVRAMPDILVHQNIGHGAHVRGFILSVGSEHIAIRHDPVRTEYLTESSCCRLEGIHGRRFSPE